MALVGDDGGRAARRSTQRLLGVVFYVGLLFFMVRGLVQELTAQRLSAESLQWLGTSGEITSSEVRNNWSRRHPCTWAEICFRYTAAGAPQTSCRATFRKSRCSPANAAALTAQYPVGAAVTVYYAPDAPEEAVLEPGSWDGENMLLRTWPLAIAFMAVLSAFAAWRLLRPPEQDAAIGEPPPPVPPQV
jgi:hypothetical protein